MHRLQYSCSFMPKKKKAASATVKAVTVTTIIKRDGRIVPFDLEKIVNAILKGMNSVGEGSQEEARMVASQVSAELFRIKKKFNNFLPTVEGVQDIVEQELMRSDYVKTAKHYVLYREERSKIRAQGLEVPEHVRKMATESKKYFRNALGEFVYYHTYLLESVLGGERFGRFSFIGLPAKTIIRTVGRHH